MYLLAFLVAYMLVGRLQSKRNLHLTTDTIGSLLTWSVIGVIVGGRLGYVLFYGFTYFLHHPVEILAVWNG